MTSSDPCALLDVEGPMQDPVTFARNHRHDVVQAIVANAWTHSFVDAIASSGAHLASVFRRPTSRSP
jgi:hypothetical protein